MIGLMLEQCIVGMVVKLLNQANEHIRDIIQTAGRLNDNQRRSKRQSLWICTIVDRPKSSERASAANYLTLISGTSAKTSVGIAC